LTLKFLIEKFALKHVPHAEIELIFGNLALTGISLGAVGLLIIYAGVRAERSGRPARADLQGSSLIGVVQGICLPFRGFSRSGATISAGLLLGIAKERAEDFSFALAVVLTPPVIIREVMRLLKARGLAPSPCRRLCPLLSQSPGDGLQFPGGALGAPLALPLAGARPLAPLRHLLPFGLGHGPLAL
jgi:undecaprenyl-diphosphatase